MKNTKKLVLNIEKVRELVETSLERVNGGYFQSAGSDWCSSQGARKCTYGCATDASSLCIQR